MYVYMYNKYTYVCILFLNIYIIRNASIAFTGKRFVLTSFLLSTQPSQRAFSIFLWENITVYYFFNDAVKICEERE